MGYPKIFHDSRLDDGVPAASTTATGFDVLNLRDWRPYTKWQPTALPATVTVDCGVAKAADYGLVWGNDLHTHGIRAEFRGSTDNFSASDVLLGQVSPPSGGKAGLLAQWTAASYRYWRMNLEYVNLLIWSEEFDNAAWAKSRSSVSANATTAPDGTVTADELIEDTGTGEHYLDQNFSVTSGVVYTLSVHVAAASGLRTLRLRSHTVTSAFCDFDPATGLLGTPSNCTAAVEPVANGFYRVSITVTAGSTGTLGCRIQMYPTSGSTSYTGDGTSGLYVWGAQLEEASTPSDYFKVEAANAGIPTLGISSIGTALEIPQYLREGFDPVGRTPMGVFNKSVAGMPLGHVIQYEEWAQSLTFELLTWAWLRDTWEPAWNAHLRGTPFVFSWDSAGHADELVLATVAGGFRTPHRAGSRADLQLDLVGLRA